jgi:hypothetical protein
MGIPTSRNPNTSEGLENWLSVRIHRILAELPHSIEPEWIPVELLRSSYEEGSRQAKRPSSTQSLTTLLTRLYLATTLRMRALQVKFPKCGVCTLIFTVGRVFIGPWGSSTELEKSVWCQVVAGRLAKAASIDFLHRPGLLLLV